MRVLNLVVEPGELVALIGSNGAGKSTLLRTISGLIRPWSGRISYEDREVGGHRPYEIFDRGMVQVPEGRAILKRMTVAENLQLGAFRRRDAAVKQDMERVYDYFPVLQQRMQQKAGTLSGGEQQMLAIGRALMSRPKLLMLDEPSLGLAPKLVAEIFAIIRRLNAEGIAILLVEQNARLALESAHRAYVLETGKIVLTGPASELAGNDFVRKVYLGAHV
jgi:branched-chain amino acid transport system ATP-binding protein